MIQPLLLTFGLLGIAFGLFGIALARLLLGDGAERDAYETGHNARLILVTGTTLIIVSLAGIR
jgi:hypothetical protein